MPGCKAPLPSPTYLCPPKRGLRAGGSGYAQAGEILRSEAYLMYVATTKDEPACPAYRQAGGRQGERRRWAFFIGLIDIGLIDLTHAIPKC